MEKKYTNIVFGDGFGAQYQKIIQTFIYCKHNNLSFVYRPIRKIEHNYDNDLNYIDNIEKMINLKSNMEIDLHNESEEISFNHIIRNWFENDIDNNCNNENMEFIKKCFWENKNKNVYNNDKINVAVHVRRPNPHDNRLEGANTPDNYYLNVIDIIRQKYQDKNLLFHIYSQGKKENFKDYENKDTLLHINEDICKTFIGLVGADILVTSASSFSYVAALISDGEVYYKKFWHKPKKEWIIC